MRALVAAVLLWVSSCSSPLTQLGSTHACEVRDGFVAVHEAGKDAIPMLIDAIDDRSPAQSLVRDSSLEDADSTTELGVLAAYSIELILARPSLSTTPDSDCSSSLDRADYVYPRGTLEWKTGGTADLTEVQAVYRRWWDASADKPLATLRAEWAGGEGPLAGSAFAWR
jgi:hypothetical protein